MGFRVGYDLTMNDDPEFEVRMQVRQAIERIESGGEARGTVWQQLTRPSE